MKTILLEYKNFLAGFLIAFVVVLMSFSLMVFAQDITSTPPAPTPTPTPFPTLSSTPAPTPAPSPIPEPERKMKQLLEINPNGKVQLRNAKVESVASTSLSVKVWAHVFTIEVNSETKLRGHGEGRIEMTDVKVGDVVDVNGSMNEDTGVITARELRDDSARSKKDVEREGKISEIRKLIENLKKQLEGLLGKNREKNRDKHDGEDD